MLFRSHESLLAADELAKEGIEAEVVDLRTVSPLDEETILGSVKRTGRVVLVQEAQRQAGINSQVAALIAEKGILSLEAPIACVFIVAGMVIIKKKKRSNKAGIDDHDNDR